MPVAPELSGLGTDHMAVTTRTPQAQAFFDQGLRLLYAFNHQESRRAFQEAARLDPALAMAHWGEAITLAPNLNAPMTPEQRPAGASGHPGGPAAERSARADGARAHRRAAPGASPTTRPRRGRRSTAPTPRRWRAWPRGYPDRAERADAVRGRGDEHDAVGLLAEGRHAEAGDGDADGNAGAA